MISHLRGGGIRRRQRHPAQPIGPNVAGIARFQRGLQLPASSSTRRRQHDHRLARQRQRRRRQRRRRAFKHLASSARRSATSSRATPSASTRSAVRSATAAPASVSTTSSTRRSAAPATARATSSPTTPAAGRRGRLLRDLFELHLGHAPRQSEPHPLEPHLHQLRARHRPRERRLRRRRHGERRRRRRLRRQRPAELAGAHQRHVEREHVDGERAGPHAWVRRAASPIACSSSRIAACDTVNGNGEGQSFLGEASRVGRRQRGHGESAACRSRTATS